MTKELKKQIEVPEFIVDLVDEYFPKGESKDRGKANVLVARILMWHTEQVESLVSEAERRARVDEVKNMTAPYFYQIPPVRQPKMRNTSIKLYAVKFLNGVMKKRRQARLAELEALTPDTHKGEQS